MSWLSIDCAAAGDPGHVSAGKFREHGRHLCYRWDGCLIPVCACFCGLQSLWLQRLSDPRKCFGSPLLQVRPQMCCGALCPAPLGRSITSLYCCRRPGSLVSAPARRPLLRGARPVLEGRTGPRRSRVTGLHQREPWWQHPRRNDRRHSWGQHWRHSRRQSIRKSRAHACRRKRQRQSAREPCPTRWGRKQG